MKIQSKLVVAITALAISHFVFAEDAAPDTPKIAVCPEPCIFPEAPEVSVLPFSIEREDPADRIHIDPVVEPEIQPELDPENQPEVDPVVDPKVDVPTDIDSSEGSDGKDGEGKIVDSSDSNDDFATTTSVKDSPVVDRAENEVPIELLKRGAENSAELFSTCAYPVTAVVNSAVFFSTGANSVTGVFNSGVPLSIGANPVTAVVNAVAAPENAEAPKALARELRQDDKAAAIGTKIDATSPKILSEKKEPVALIKKGRVFLR